jgi:hypothetical protein
MDLVQAGRVTGYIMMALMVVLFVRKFSSEKKK